MLQTTFKVHEQLQKWHLDDLLWGHPVSDLQHAFIQGEGKGTESAIAETINFIEQTSKRDQHYITIFLDVDGAYSFLC